MKNVTFLYFLIIAVSSRALMADPVMDEFLAKVKKANLNKDSAALESLYYTKGASPLDLERLRYMIAMGFKYTPQTELLSVRAIPFANEDEKALLQVVNGEKIERNMEAVGMIELKYDKAASRGPYGFKDGKPWLVGFRVTKLDWKGPPDRPFWISIQNSSDKHRKVVVEGTYNASGVEMNLKRTHQFISNGNTSTGGWSTGFNGQRLITIKITTDDEDGELKATIKEGEKPGSMPDKLIIEQAISASKPLIYEGKKQ